MKSDHRLRLILTLVAALGVVLWLTLGPNERANSAARPAAAEPVRTRAPQEPDAPAASAPELAAAPRAEAAAPAPAEPAGPEAAAEPGPRADLEARSWVVFRITNERGFPVQGAEIVLTGLRTEREPINHHAWRTEPSLGHTQADGSLRLAYPVWVTGDDVAGQLSFTVAHPDYATHESYGTAITPEIDSEIEVVLELGSVLVVSGWIDDPGRVITDVAAGFSWDVDVDAADWFPRRDGRLSTARVPQGSHLVMLEHESPEHGLCFSEPTEFTLQPGETEELHLELEPALRITGRLDASVPRPVLDGVVVLALQSRTSDRRTTLLRARQQPVQPDGSFVFERVARADAQVVALCRGWASVSREEIEEYTTEDGGTGQWIHEAVPQAVELHGEVGELVVAMEPTAALEVELTLPNGRPAPGVEVSVWPNVCWRLGACALFVDGRSWSATTDEEGRARIEDLPAGEHWLGVRHPELDLPLEPPGDQGNRSRSARFTPGATVHASYTLERTGGG